MGKKKACAELLQGRCWTMCIHRKYSLLSITKAVNCHEDDTSNRTFEGLCWFLLKICCTKWELGTTFVLVLKWAIFRAHTVICVTGNLWLWPKHREWQCLWALKVGILFSNFTVWNSTESTANSAKTVQKMSLSPSVPFVRLNLLSELVYKNKLDPLPLQSFLSCKLLL